MKINALLRRKEYLKVSGVDVALVIDRLLDRVEVVRKCRVEEESRGLHVSLTYDEE